MGESATEILRKREREKTAERERGRGSKRE